MCFYESGFRHHTNQSVGFSFICRPPEVWERVWMIHNEQAVRWTPLHCVNVSCVYDFSTASQIQSIYLLSPVVSVDWRVNQTTNQTQGWTAFNCCGHDLLKTIRLFFCHIQLSAFYCPTFEEEIEAAAFRPSHTAASIHEAFIRPHD